MSIKRMLLLASMALAAIAFAAPAVAQATVELTDPKNKRVAVGKEITATSTNLTTTTEAGGVLACAKVTLHFIVRANNGEHVILDPNTTEAITEGCTATSGETVLPVTITDGTVLSPLTLDTWGTGYAAAKFISDVWGDAGHSVLLQRCEFIGAVHVAGTTSGTDVVSAGPSVLAGINTGVGECSKQATIQGSFTLETSNGTEVTLDFVKTG